nr:hypothetical protein [uncultured Sphingomonas sp.]
MKLKKPWYHEALDQACHFLIAYGVVTLLIVVGAVFTPLAAAVLGFALAATREITEGGNILSNGSLRDTFFWTLGGLMGAF